MMNKARKESEIGSLSDKFKKAKATFLIDFKGMKVGQVTELRKSLAPVEAEMKVVRNTLAIRSLAKFPEMEKALSSSLKGTNALVFAYGDVAAPAKTLAKFAQDIELMQLKSGAMDGQVLDQNKIKFLATLPGKDVLRAQLLGVLNAPGTKLARTLKEVPATMVRVLAAKK
jgi:large subunit ribosomal protein L10